MYFINQIAQYRRLYQELTYSDAVKAKAKVFKHTATVEMNIPSTSDSLTG